MADLNLGRELGWTATAGTIKACKYEPWSPDRDPAACGAPVEAEAEAHAIARRRRVGSLSLGSLSQLSKVVVLFIKRDERPS